MTNLSLTLFLASICLGSGFMPRFQGLNRHQALYNGACDDPYKIGDPSLTLTTNMDMGGKEAKLAFMRKASKIVSEVLGKPETYVAIAVLDNQSMIWAGEDTPCCLGTLNSLGAINLENNGQITAQVSELLSEFSIPKDRIYITFNDIARENMGWNGKTFAG